MKTLEKEIELLEKKVRLLKELRELEGAPTRIEFVIAQPALPEPPKPYSPQPWTQPWPNYPQPYVGDWPIGTTWISTSGATGSLWNGKTTTDTAIPKDTDQITYTC